jgi:O-antigen/teichoic acid export membrane protein
VTLVPRYVVARVELRQFAGDSQRLDAAARQILSNMSGLAFPLCVGGAAVVPTLFHAWLDPRWYGGIIPAELMLLMSLPFVTQYCVGAMLLAFNRQSSEAKLSLVQTILTLLMVIVFAPFGLIAATAAFALRPLLSLPLAVQVARKQCAVPARLFYESQRPTLIAAAAMGVVVTGARLALQPWLPSVLLLPLLVALGAGCYGLLMSVLMPGFLGQFLARFRTS